MEEHNDFQAIARLKQGDLAGLDTLVMLYQLQAVRTTYLIVGDRPLAEDIVQNAFVRLAQTIQQFDAARPFGPWFLRSVINEAIKAAGRQKRQVSIETADTVQAAALIEMLADPQPGPEEQAIRAETCQEVWQALERLNPEQRAAVVQRYYLGYSEAEMSLLLQRPAGTVKWLLYTARQKLRDWLAVFAPSEPDSGPEAVYEEEYKL